MRRRDDTIKDPPGDVLRAYSPYLIIIAIFSIAQIPAIKDALAESPWTTKFQWPGPRHHDRGRRGRCSLTFNFNWLPAAGTLLLISGLITMPVLGVSPAARVKRRRAVARPAQVGDPHRRGGAGAGLRHEPVGPDHHASAKWAAGAGGAFAFLSSFIGWLGVAVTARTPPPTRCSARSRWRPPRSRPAAGPACRGQQLGRRAGQDDLAPEPGHRRRGGGHGRQGGRPVPQGGRLEHRAGLRHGRARLPAVHARARLDGPRRPTGQ